MDASLWAEQMLLVRGTPFPPGNLDSIAKEDFITISHESSAILQMLAPMLIELVRKASYAFAARHVVLAEILCAVSRCGVRRAWAEMNWAKRVVEDCFVITAGDVVEYVVSAIVARFPIRRRVWRSCHALMLGGDSCEGRPESEEVWFAHCASVAKSLLFDSGLDLRLITLSVVLARFGHR